MDFKKGNWNIADLANEDLIDDKMAKNVADDIRKQLEKANIKPHKPLLAQSGAPPLSKGGVRPDLQYSRLVTGDSKRSPALKNVGSEISVN